MKLCASCQEPADRGALIHDQGHTFHHECRQGDIKARAAIQADQLVARDDGLEMARAVAEIVSWAA